MIYLFDGKSKKGRKMKNKGKKWKIHTTLYTDRYMYAIVLYINSTPDIL